MDLYTKDVTALLAHWSYVFFCMKPSIYLVTTQLLNFSVNTLASTPIRHRSESKVSDQCLKDAEPTVFVVYAS